MSGPWAKFEQRTDQQESGPWAQFDRRANARAMVENDPISQGARNFARDMSFGEKFNAGVGKAFYDIARGTAQVFGGGPSAEEVRENRGLDAPLMRTGAGLSGNIAGNLTLMAPAAVVPGANTVPAAAGMGAILAALQPTETQGERAVNMAKGGVLGGAVQYAGSGLATALGHRAAAKEAERARNQVADETLRRGREAGYSLPPSATGQSGFISNRLESFGGKGAIAQQGSADNQLITNRLSREDASLGPNEALSVEALRTARQRLSQPYRDISALSPAAKAELEAVQIARQDSKLNWKEHNRQGTVSAYKAAKEADDKVKAGLDKIEQEAAAAGRPELVNELKKARVAIAQNHQVQAGLNRGSGNVDAAVIGRALDNGAPLKGNLETIGRMQQAHPRYMREADGVPPANISGTEWMASALLSGAGGAASQYTTQSPLGAVAGFLPLLRGPARSIVLNQGMKEPGTSGLTQAAANLLPPDRAALLARALALPPAVGQ